MDESSWAFPPNKSKVTSFKSLNLSEDLGGIYSRKKTVLCQWHIENSSKRYIKKINIFGNENKFHSGCVRRFSPTNKSIQYRRNWFLKIRSPYINHALESFIVRNFGKFTKFVESAVFGSRARHTRANAIFRSDTTGRPGKPFVYVSLSTGKRT